MKGLSREALRSNVEIAIRRSKTPTLDFFAQAAREYAPQTGLKEIRRKVGRFLDGYAPPQFVVQHTMTLLRELAMRTT